MSESFPLSQLFASSGQSIGTSVSASVLPVNIQGWFPLGLTGLILLSKGLSAIFSSTTVWKHQFFSAQPSLRSNSYIHPYMTTGKTMALTIWIFVSKVTSLFFTMLSLSQLFFQGASSFNFMAAVTVCSDFGAQEDKISHCFHFSPICLPRSDGTGCHALSFLNVECLASFFTLLFHPRQEVLEFLFTFCR